MSIEFYSDNDYFRIESEKQTDLDPEPYRSPFWRDYARLLHSPSFRRLTGKTQLFPNNETDFFRNRLTHSLEVAQIAKSITLRLNYNNKIKIDPDLVSFAALAHDLGHPPFGHQGEEALDECMQEFGGFEGNAQTLRIISKIEKKFYREECPSGIDDKGIDIRCGLNLTYRSLAAILKYDNVIPESKLERGEYAEAKGSSKIHPVKGYYQVEDELIKKIKSTLVPSDIGIPFKTIECSIMDIADDIAYSNYDLEDAFKAGFLSPLDLLYPKDQLLDNIVESVNKRNNFILEADEVREILISIYGDILDLPDEYKTEEFKDEDQLFGFNYYSTGLAYEASNEVVKHGGMRTELTSRLVGKFIRGIEMEVNKEYPILSKIKVDEAIQKEIEVLKTFTFQSQILSPRLKVAELRGKAIVKSIFKVLQEKGNHQLLPKDYQEIYLRIDDSQKNRIICDFIAGMTNKYAIEFYGRLTSEDPETIFKPL